MTSRRAVLAAVAVASLVIGLLAWLRTGDRVETTAAGEVVVVAPRTFSSTVVAVGAVKPRIGSEVRVGSRISGRVWKLRANIGDRVEQGQVIAELETAELDALIGQRRAELKLAEAKLAAFDTLAPEEEARARADVSRVSAEAAFAAQEWQRQQALLERLRAPLAHPRHRRVGRDTGGRNRRGGPQCANVRDDCRSRSLAAQRVRRRSRHRQDRTGPISHLHGRCIPGEGLQ